MRNDQPVSVKSISILCAVTFVQPFGEIFESRFVMTALASSFSILRIFVPLGTVLGFVSYTTVQISGAPLIIYPYLIFPASSSRRTLNWAAVLFANAWL